MGTPKFMFKNASLRGQHHFYILFEYELQIFKAKT